MTNEQNRDMPFLTPEAAPDHGPNFWADLDTALRAEGAPGRPDRTTQMPPVVTELAPRQPQRSRRMWPMAAAAAVLALVGLGFLAAQGGNDEPAEVVSGADDAVQAPAAAAAPAVGDPTESAEPEPAQASDPGAAAVPAPTVAPELETTFELSFEAALGADGDSVKVPRDGGIPADSRWLATWDDRALTWYGVTTPGTTCADRDHTRIKYVNAAGFTHLVRDPQPGFSGEISHFTVDNDNQTAAWLVSCDDQVELYAATLVDTGDIENFDLVWIGQARVLSALLLWTDGELSFNAIGTDGRPFFVDYSFEQGLLGRDAKPIEIMLQDGAPPWRNQTPLDASANGRLSYWAGEADGDQTDACGTALTGAAVSTLWVHQGTDQWSRALVDPILLGDVSALALEPGSGQVAFADHCGGTNARLFVGTQRADGMVADPLIIELVPFAPGVVNQLTWIDAQTLRVETDTTGDDLRGVDYNYVLDEGLRSGVLVLQG